MFPDTGVFHLADLPARKLLIFSVLSMAAILIFLVALCAGFGRKRKYGGEQEPVTLLSRQQRSDYEHANGLLSKENATSRSLSPLNVDLRTNSPNWRNSLTRELPAIPDSQDPLQSECASNVYACLDDVRVAATHDPDLSDSSQENVSPVLQPHQRVHPYDRISTPAAAGVFMSPSPAVVNEHARILQQMDNDPNSYSQNYGGAANSIMSYTSITVRTPLTDLQLRRTSEDGYSKVDDDNHLYAQVGGDYGGSTASDQVASQHIYNELYSEIDSGRGRLIDPYATSRTVPGNSFSSSPPLSQEDLDKLYAKIHKPSTSSETNTAQSSQLPSTSAGPSLPNGRVEQSRHPDSLLSSIAESSSPKPYVRKEHVYEQLIE